MKEQPGQNLLIYGSGELIQTLMQHDLIDEYHFMVNPVIVGSGKHLFKTGNDTKVLKLIETRTTSSGVVILSYQPEKRIIIDKLYNQKRLTLSDQEKLKITSNNENNVNKLSM